MDSASIVDLNSTARQLRTYRPRVYTVTTPKCIQPSVCIWFSDRSRARLILITPLLTWAASIYAITRGAFNQCTFHLGFCCIRLFI